MGGSVAPLPRDTSANEFWFFSPCLVKEKRNFVECCSSLAQERGDAKRQKKSTFASASLSSQLFLNRLLPPSTRNLQVSSDLPPTLLTREVTSACAQWQMRASQGAPLRSQRGGAGLKLPSGESMLICHRTFSLVPSPSLSPPRKLQQSSHHFTNYNGLLQGACLRGDCGRVGGGIEQLKARKRLEISPRPLGRKRCPPLLANFSIDPGPIAALLLVR